MRKISYLVLLWTLMAGASSAEGMKMLEEALELSASRVSFSLTGAGSITVRTCRDCAPKSLPLAAGTVFFANDELVERDTFAELSRQGGEVYVFYDTETGIVTRMRLITRTQNVRRSRQ